MSKPSLVIVLVEDQRQRQLIYRYLNDAGLRPDQIRVHVSPSGRGSAEQWVRKSFAVQVSICRARQARTGMFVMLDADMRTVQERLAALDGALQNAGQPPIDRHRDPIARLIPKRNVETWILYLTSSGVAVRLVNEEQDFKPTKSREEWNSLIPSAVEKLVELTTSAARLPPNLLNSLRHGIREIPRALPPER